MLHQIYSFSWSVRYATYLLIVIHYFSLFANDHFLGCVYSDPPSVSEGSDVGVTLGQRGVLLCEADAVPEADFEWYRDDRRYDITKL